MLPQQIQTEDPVREWCYRTHDIKINNASAFQHYMGPIGCPSNPINDEQDPGNWEPNRAGWCPGSSSCKNG